MSESALLSRDRLVYVGKTGYGKSRAVKQLCSELQARGRRLVVFDPCDEYSQHGNASAETDLGPVRDRLTARELYRDPRALDAPRLSLAVVPDKDDPKRVALDFERVAELVRATGNCVLVVEEVGYFAEHAQSPLKNVATMARKDGVAVVMVAQRAVQIPLTARSQASVIVAFHQDEPADLEALEERCGRAMPGIAEQLPQLRVGESVTWRDLPPSSSKGLTP